MQSISTSRKVGNSKVASIACGSHFIKQSSKNENKQKESWTSREMTWYYTIRSYGMRGIHSLSILTNGGYRVKRCLSSWILTYSQWYMVQEWWSQYQSQKTMSEKMISWLLHSNPEYSRWRVTYIHWAQAHWLRRWMKRWAKKDDQDTQLNPKCCSTLCILSRESIWDSWEIYWDIKTRLFISKMFAFPEKLYTMFLVRCGNWYFH